MSNQDETPERPEADTRSAFGQSTRRTFLSRLGMASLLATAGPAVTTFRQGRASDFTRIKRRHSGNAPCERQEARSADRSAHHASRLPSRASESDRIEKGMRSRSVRCVHCPHQRPARKFLSFICRDARRRGNHNHRRRRTAGKFTRRSSRVRCQ